MLMSVGAWLVRKIGLGWTVAALIAMVTVGGVGLMRAWDAFGDWLDARTVAKLREQNAELRADIAALQDYQRRQAAANQAATEAEDRNHAEMPKSRAATAARVSRAHADAAQRLLDDQAAASDYAAAARQLSRARDP